MNNGNENTKKCGFCGMDVPAEAGRCQYCGSLLEQRADRNIFTDPPDTEVKSGEDDETLSSEANGDLDGYKAHDEPKQDFRPVFEAKFTSGEGSGYRQDYGRPSEERGKGPLSNGLKVFLTILFTVIPGIGQLAGIITAIVFMNADDDADRKSFGVALLVACVVMFVLSCIGCFLLTLVFSINQSSIFYGN